MGIKVDTLNAKPFEERIKVIQSNVSKPELKLLAELNLDRNLHSNIIIAKNKENWCRYDIVVDNKIIEFYGDYWHCNPLKFKADTYHSRVHKTAKEVWKHDKKRINFARRNGYKVLIIWEYDFKHNHFATINKCKKFLSKGDNK